MQFLISFMDNLTREDDMFLVFKKEYVSEEVFDKNEEKHLFSFELAP